MLALVATTPTCSGDGAPLWPTVLAVSAAAAAAVSPEDNLRAAPPPPEPSRLPTSTSPRGGLLPARPAPPPDDPASPSAPGRPPDRRTADAGLDVATRGPPAAMAALMLPLPPRPDAVLSVAGGGVMWLLPGDEEAPAPALASQGAKSSA